MEKEYETLLRFVQRNELDSLKTHLDDFEQTNCKNNSSFSLCKIYRKSTGDGLLHVAARFGRIDILRSQGCNLEQGNLDGKTALHDAAQFSHLEGVQLLLKNGANVNAVKKADWTPLMLACTKQDLAIVETLLEFGADPKFQNKDGWNSFHIACREGNIEIVRLLFQTNEDLISSPSRNGRRPIHTAVMHGHGKIVEFILEKCSAEANGEDNCGTTPVMDSCRFGFCKILEILIESGADFKVLNKAGQNCLHIASEAGQNDVIQLLISQFHFDVNSVGKHGMTSLHYAVKEDQVETVACLLKLGASLDLKDEQGRQCIDLAIGLKKEQVLNSNLLSKSFQAKNV